MVMNLKYGFTFSRLIMPLPVHVGGRLADSTLSYTPITQDTFIRNPVVVASRSYS